MVFADKGAFGADGDGDKLKKNRFLSTTKEVEDLNQYWYSNRTISAMARDVATPPASISAWTASSSSSIASTEFCEANHE